MNTTIKTHTVHGEPMHIHIRLSDSCKNGHNEFAITADIWHKGAHKLTERNIDRCGCCHEDILKKNPSLKLFVDLHLSDESGAPMNAVENGYYHLQGVKGTASYGHTMTLKGFAEYMRIDLDEAQKAVEEITNKDQFITWVDTLRPLWKKEANQAKERLAELINENATN